MKDAIRHALDLALSQMKMLRLSCSDLSPGEALIHDAIVARIETVLGHAAAPVEEATPAAQVHKAGGPLDVVPVVLSASVEPGQPLYAHASEAAQTIKQLTAERDELLQLLREAAPDLGVAAASWNEDDSAEVREHHVSRVLSLIARVRAALGVQR